MSKTITRRASELQVGDPIFDYQEKCALLTRKSAVPITQIWHHDYADGTPGLVTVLTKRGYVEYDGSSLVTVQGW